MKSIQPVKGLSPELVNRVLTGLAITAPKERNVKSLQDLYAAWCRNLPFDNVRKMIALATSKKMLPGLDAADFFEN